MFVNTILIMSNVARLQLIYGVTDVILNCQSKLILKVIQGHQGEKSHWHVTTHKSENVFRSARRIPTVKSKIPGKLFPSRIQNFCYIQVIVFDLSYLPVAAVGT